MAIAASARSATERGKKVFDRVRLGPWRALTSISFLLYGFGHWLDPRDIQVLIIHASKELIVEGGVFVRHHRRFVVLICYATVHTRMRRRAALLQPLSFFAQTRQVIACTSRSRGEVT